MSFFSFGKRNKHPVRKAQPSREEAVNVVPVNSARGTFSIRWTSKGVLLKVTPPAGNGRTVVTEEVLKALAARGMRPFDADMLKQVIRDEASSFVPIGPPPPEDAVEAPCVATISGDKHHAFLTLTAPEKGQRDVEVEAMKQKLEEAGVVFGMDEQALQNLFENPVYGKPVTVASWQRTVDGQNGEIILQFDAARKQEVNLVEVNGRVDYRDMSIVKSVPAGAVLATQTPPTEGEPGVLVTGAQAPATPGKVAPLKVGENVRLSEDGLQAIAEKSGQPVVRNRRIEIDEECVVRDVTLETGNINFEGHVLIRGSIEDDFKVQSSDSIEVMEAIGAASVVAAGDIRVRGGIMGKGRSFIRAGGSVYARFIDNADIEAEGGVYADDGISHSRIDAGDEVVCVKKRGAIFGGRIRAGLRVEANILGKVAAPETEILVGMDPVKRQRLKELDKEQRINARETEATKSNLETLRKIKASQGKLSQERQEQLDALFLKDKELDRQRKRIEGEQQTLNEHPYDPSTTAQVIVRKQAFPNVRIQISAPEITLQTECKRKVFVLEDGRIGELPIDRASKPVREQ